MNRIYLCIISSDKEYENLNELTENYDKFDGLFVVLHPQSDDEDDMKKVVSLLETRVGDGAIIVRPFLHHHAHSMNEWLFHPKIDVYDICVIRDSSERIKPMFFTQIVDHLKNNRSDSKPIVYPRVFVGGKLAMFTRFPNQQFINGIHWGLHGDSAFDLKDIALPDDNDFFYSKRNVNRPKDHRYYHEAKYMIEYSLNGNHYQLFANNANYRELTYENLLFASFCSFNKIKKVEDFLNFLKSNDISKDTQFIKTLNTLRPLKNFYRYTILGHTNEEILLDEDTYIIKFPIQESQNEN